MNSSNSIGSLVWAITVFLIVVMIGGPLILLRKPDDKRLIVLSLFACLVALAFAPLLRAVPNQVSFPLFFIGLWPTLAVIAVSVVASIVRVIQTRSIHSILSLILSVLAVGLFYISSATPLIWPYKTH